tara:strand:+ start:232 stop:447 length:216 start_codon:yes stop_codon:yes gene_type:complete
VEVKVLGILKEMTTSKKFIAAIAGTIVAFLATVGLDLPPGDVAALIGPIVAYIIGQGWADSGKEAAKLNSK